MNDVNNTSAPTYTTWRYHTDPEFRADMIKRSVEYRRTRRQADPEYDEKIKQQWRENARKNAQDPEKQAKRKEYLRNYYLRKKAQKEQLDCAPVNWTQTI